MNLVKGLLLSFREHRWFGLFIILVLQGSFETAHVAPERNPRLSTSEDQQRRSRHVPAQAVRGTMDN